MELPKLICRSFLVIAVFGFFMIERLAAQKPPAKHEGFREIVEKRLKQRGLRFADVCPVDKNEAARRIFSDYGAIFLSQSDELVPTRCIFASEAEVAEFQQRLPATTAVIGGTSVTLRKTAMDAFVAAREEAAKKGLSITPRGGSTASKRTFTETVRLWNSRFLPGLEHWVGSSKISRKEADAARNASIPEQVKKVLEWEKNGLYFSKDFSKSILYSVAAPGASQHVFLLALDVEQYSNRTVRQILAKHGWFQTVKSDLPHFTFLGVSEDELPGLGLRSTSVGDQIFWIPNFE